MTIADSYHALARLVDYPADKAEMLSSCNLVSSFMEELGNERNTLASFADFTAKTPLAALQEEYVATFDFNPATAPYLGHHLFGDNQKKGGYMIMLKQEFARCGYSPASVELPDHLSVLLAFLAHLARNDVDNEESGERQKFITDCILPGMERMNSAFSDRKYSHWKELLETAQQLCAADCKEVRSC